MYRDYYYWLHKKQCEVVKRPLRDHHPYTHRRKFFSSLISSLRSPPTITEVSAVRTTQPLSSPRNILRERERDTQRHRERERERNRQTDRHRKRERGVCMFLCVYAVYLGLR